MSESPSWTSDLLLNEDGMPVYCEQVRLMFRDHREHFRALAIEVNADLVADPIQGDGKVQARLRAWKVARILRQMERHAQSIVALGKQLDATHRKHYIELPKERERAETQKALDKAGRAHVAGQSAAALNDAVRQALPVVPGQSATTPTDSVLQPPPFDLFGRAG